MKKLHKFILKSYLGPFVLTFFIVVFVLLMQFLWKYIDDLVGKGLEIPVISELLLYTTASLVPMAIPLAVLLASLMCFGDLGENNELVALKSAGISLPRIMAPLVILIVFITIGAFLFNNHVLPSANLKFRSLLYDIQKQSPEMQIKPGIFDNSIQGYSIRVEEKVQGSSLLKRIQIYDHTNNMGNIIVTVADSGYIRQADNNHLLFTLYNGYTYTEMQLTKRARIERSYPMRRDYFEVQDMIVEISDLGLQRTDENLFKNSYQMMNLSQLTYMEDSLQKEIVLEQRYLSNTLLVACLGKTKQIRSGEPVRDTVRKEEIKPAVDKKETKRPLKKIFGATGNKILNVTEELKTTVMSDTVRVMKMKQKTAIKEVPPAAPVQENTTITGSDEMRKSEKSREEEVKIIPVETIFNSIPHDQRVSVINQAINLAGTAKNYINNTFFSADSKIRRLRRYQIEEHKKYTLSLACLVFFFIGAPLGAIIRKGGLGMPVIVSVLFFILWYIISLVGEKFARESVITPFLGIWLSTIVLIPLGFLLTYKASKDSMILNLEFYSNFINKVLNYIKKNWLLIEQ